LKKPGLNFSIRIYKGLRGSLFIWPCKCDAS